MAVYVSDMLPLIGVTMVIFFTTLVAYGITDNVEPELAEVITKAHLVIIFILLGVFIFLTYGIIKKMRMKEK